MAKVTRGGVIIDRSNLDRLLKKMEILSRKEIRWGFFSNSRYGPKNDNMYVASIAKLQEDGGVGDAGNVIPERPFFTTQLLRIIEPGDYYSQKARSFMAQAAGSIFKGGTDAAIFQSFGKSLKESLQGEILAFNNPPNARNTVRKKGFDDPLIHTGVMYDSVEYRVIQTRKEKDIA